MAVNSNRVSEITGTQRQLAQVRPSGTSAVSLFSVPYFGQLNADVLHVCNVSAAPVNISIFHDVDGTTWDQTTALLYTYVLQVGGAIQIDAPLGDYQFLGSVGVQVSIANAATFTLYGSLDGETLVP